MFPYKKTDIITMTITIYSKFLLVFFLLLSFFLQFSVFISLKELCLLLFFPHPIFDFVFFILSTVHSCTGSWFITLHFSILFFPSHTLFPKTISLIPSRPPLSILFHFFFFFSVLLFLILHNNINNNPNK